jgi:ATP-dependent Clp protease ATP-binding subunit ClpC
MASEAGATRTWGEQRGGAVLQHLAELLPLADLSNTNGNGPEPVPAVRSQRVEECLREAGLRLHRSQSPHLLLVGRRGVGKTSIVQQIGGRVTQRPDRPLDGSRLLWLDCRNVGPEDSRACLESIFAAIAQLGTECLLCLDGIAALLKRPQGGTNKPLLRTLLSRPGLRVVGVMEHTEFNEQIGSDASMLDCFSRIDIPEPDDLETLEIVRHHARQLVERTGLSIGDHVCQRLVALSSVFLQAEAQPKKSVRLLHQVFDDSVYERDTLGRERTQVDLSDIEAALSERTGIPAAVIAGQREEIDIEAILSDAVVGQPTVVRCPSSDVCAGFE